MNQIQDFGTSAQLRPSLGTNLLWTRHLILVVSWSQGQESTRFATIPFNRYYWTWTILRPQCTPHSPTHQQ